MTKKKAVNDKRVLPFQYFQFNSMKQIIFILSILLFSNPLFSQKSIHERYLQGYSLSQVNKFSEAYDIYKEIKPKIEVTDTLYNYVVWYYVEATTQLEKNFFAKQDYTSSLKYGLEAMQLIQNNKQYFDEQFAQREAWMMKDIIVAYFGLGQLDEANQFKEILYKAYREKTLPKGIDQYFNFDFFKIDSLNIWGYEWYPELPEDRISTSFTKIVYYVYSTNPDGSDDKQLYRFHVLMYHQDNKDTKFDYILEKQQEINNTTVSSSFFKFVYKKDIDYNKLKRDVIEIIRTNLQPATRRITTQRN